MAVGDRIPRFFPRRPDIRWVGAIHEDLRYTPDPKRTLLIADTGLRAIHFGYDPSRVQSPRQGPTQPRHPAASSGAESRRCANDLLHRSQHFAIKRFQESLPWFNAFLESTHDLPTTYDVEAFSNLLTAQFELRDSAGCAARVSRQSRAARCRQPAAWPWARMPRRTARSRQRLGTPSGLSIRVCQPDSRGIRPSVAGAVECGWP